MKRMFMYFVGLLIGMIVANSLPIMSVDKGGYDTVAHYKLFDRIYTPYELDMLCK